jgi:hypothetical protein
VAATLVEHAAAGFSNGSGGHAVAFSGGPAAGQLDVVTVNSNTVVATPTGFTLGRARVNSQGSYIFYRIAAGGEAAAVTITTAGDHSTVATWSRWAGAAAFDVAADAGVDSSSGLTTPALSTGALAGTNELVVVLAALHNLSSGVVPNTAVWSPGYTPLDTASDITGPGGDGAHVAALTGYRTDAGTAAESPNVSWTGVASDRYILAITFTAASVPDSSVVLRPNTGTTTRPSSGQVSRPNTGRVTRP